MCFQSDQQLAERIVASGEATHERCWSLPLPEDYKELLKNDFADLNNISSSRYGGAITAALFLSEFVGDTRWAHIDIAGPAWIKKASDYCGAGGTGFGVAVAVRLDRRGLTSHACTIVDHAAGKRKMAFRSSPLRKAIRAI